MITHRDKKNILNKKLPKITTVHLKSQQRD